MLKHDPHTKTAYSLKPSPTQAPEDTAKFATHGGPHSGAMEAQGGLWPPHTMGSPGWNWLLAGPVTLWRTHTGAGCSRRTDPLERTHTRAVCEELQPDRTHIGEVCGELSPVGGEKECEEQSCWDKSEKLTATPIPHHHVPLRQKNQEWSWACEKRKGWLKVF